MQSPWYIIADDFTGSGDSVVQFSAGGGLARLALSVEEAALPARRKAACVMDSDSRYLEPEAAYERVLHIVERLKAAGARRFYKKIDSILRGNIEDELAAVMKAAGYEAAIVCPAAPRNGRSVVRGLCLVGGKPVSSALGRSDPFTPVFEARLASHFGRRFEASRLASLDLETLRSGKERLLEAVREGRKAGRTVFLADAEGMEDLSRLAELADEPGLLFAGASGLAEALARRDSPYLAAPLMRLFRPGLERCPAGSCLFVIGSVALPAQAQVRALLASGEATGIELRGEGVASAAAAERERLLELAKKAPRERALLLHTDGLVPELSPERARELGVKVSAFLGELSLELARERDARFLFVSGGDTAAKASAAFRIEAIDFTEEILPGIPYGHFLSPVLQRRLGFASKSGGFGSPEALVEILGRVAHKRGKE